MLAPPPDDACLPQARQLAAGAWADEAAFWRAQLAYAPLLLELPTDRPRPLLLSPKAGAAVVASPAGLASHLHALAAGSNATLFMVVLAAWKARRAYPPLHPVALGHRGGCVTAATAGWAGGMPCCAGPCCLDGVRRGVNEARMTEGRSCLAELYYGCWDTC